MIVEHDMKMDVGRRKCSSQKNDWNQICAFKPPQTKNDIMCLHHFPNTKYPSNSSSSLAISCSMLSPGRPWRQNWRCSQKVRVFFPSNFIKSSKIHLGGTPKSSILIGCSIIFTIHFGGFTNPPLFVRLTPWHVFSRRHFRRTAQLSQPCT